MSENIAAVSAPAGSCKKDSSPLSSPSHSAPGSPHQNRMPAPESDPESSSSSESAASSSEQVSVNAETTSANVRRPSTQDSHEDSRPQATQRPSFGLSFLSSFSNTIRGSVSSAAAAAESSGHFMSNSPTIGNLSGFAEESPSTATRGSVASAPTSQGPVVRDSQEAEAREETTMCITETRDEAPESTVAEPDTPESGKDKDGFYSIRLTPIIDHSSSNSGLYFSPVIRRIKPKDSISIGRYTEKNKSAAHAPQGSSAPVVFKSKVVSRTHALFQCNEEGSWFIKDCKSSSGTFLNNIRLSQASQESTLWPLIDGDIVQLGLDYRGGTEEVYRCVKMRCEFNRSWQRKVNRFNLDIHNRMKSLGLNTENQKGEELSECAICLFKLEPCQALFISPCSHSWHYKCIRPIIIKSYPQFYCPNCRSICDLETDIEDEDE
ncbi:putative E3 ubiquitin-protein ligase [Clavispora lusitaniae]|uniref:E3 ubiquitin-protein ligase n=1 Tax=Clavispora lusitaniae TaxID=36911 RepID=A0ACD0WCP7_CLALS|nr:hypothetical protein E0198_000817 [Clavispora lusitaniae]KAF7584232.1 FHA domain family protein [Clavispora lusitaniae]QFZ25230.1 putative E3 ubiquitin-protein ligase [Clavispora lusitaniae]QFZ31467.1 putative E3 ubiquitin-protein ligase [Clavispora lusitaniae]QFZ37135.1 putative E3 ubiquitin-protein ligase [Clavispora lusitaniae]